MNQNTLSRPLFRSERFATFGGVCAGIALSRGYSVVITRIIALFLLSLGVGFIIYLALWLLLPSSSRVSQPEPTNLPNDSLYRSSSDQVISGVCGGLAHFLNLDANLVRAIYLILVLLGGISIVPYFYAWIVMPQRNS